MTAIAERQGLFPPWFVTLAAAGLCLLQVAFLKPWNPYADEVQYLTYGRILAETGSFAATAAGPRADGAPGREPLYSVLIAAAVRLDPRLGANAARCIGTAGDAGCPPIYRSLAWANALLMAADGGWLLGLSPALFCLLAYPAVSLNLPRYQLPALASFAVAAGFAVEIGWNRWRRKGEPT